MSNDNSISPPLPYTIVSPEISKQFPIVVIELPMTSYHKHSKTQMRVASKNKGAGNYPGPLRLYEPRWKHIRVFYIIEMSQESYYLAKSLTHHPHYSVLRSEFPDYLTALTKFQQSNRTCKINRINFCKNYEDDFLIVVNDFTLLPQLRTIIDNINDEELLLELIRKGQLDKTRGNTKIDLGYACGQNLQRDLDQFGVTRPRILERTRETIFIVIQEQLSTMMDTVCDAFFLPAYHRVDNIDQCFARKLHQKGIIPSWRAAMNGPNQRLEVHEDTNNDDRELMSPVGVLSRIYLTELGPLRLTKIGYSRQSLFDSIRREQEIKPIVANFKKWEGRQPKILSTISPELFNIEPNSPIPGVIEIPCHLERAVGVSPYIHATIRLQSLMNLTRHQCVAVLYNCVTNESPFFFYSVYEYIVSCDYNARKSLAKKSPIELGVWFHENIWNRIKKKKGAKEKNALPRRHQPHNNKKPTDEKIRLSINNLIRLTDQFCFLDLNESKKQFHHSKAIAILMRTPETGGCHGCGGLTSQTLLYTLSSVGLIPIHVSSWGELAGTETSKFLECHFGLSYSEGRVEQFLNCCVASSPGYTKEQIENRICKWTRSIREDVKKSTNGNNVMPQIKFRDAIWPGQAIYQPQKDDMLTVVTKKGRMDIHPPARDWPHHRGKRDIVDADFWDQPTRSSGKRVLGGNRRSKKTKKSKEFTITRDKLLFLLPDQLELVFQSFCKPLYLSIPNLLQELVGESTPLSNAITRVERKRRGGFRFLVVKIDGERCYSPSTNLRYLCAWHCKIYETIRLAIKTNPVVLSRFIFKLIDSVNARKQLESQPDSSYGEYLLIHCNDRRIESKRHVLAVVRLISSVVAVLAVVNDNYRTDDMEFVVLKRNDK